MQRFPSDEAPQRRYAPGRPGGRGERRRGRAGERQRQGAAPACASPGARRRGRGGRGRRRREGVVAVSASAKASSTPCITPARAWRENRWRFRVATVPDGFVSGEETALLEALAGRPPKPTLKPPFPFERGLGGEPTLVQNVETLAHLALVARFGADWFRSAGLPGAARNCARDARRRCRATGRGEIELGSSARRPHRRARGASEPLSGILVGGYFGRWVSADDVELRLTPEVLGAGAVIAFPGTHARSASAPGSFATSPTRAPANAARASTGLPDRFDLELLADGRVAQDTARTRLERWTSQVAGRGACRHPDGVAGFVESALAVFAVDVDRHSTGAHCRRPSRGMLPLPGARR